ncbi:MAG: hypothetical protein IT462_03830 [Planctomycetes bacterium]|nr:hypothetical protein [Planctomycetota bacterium]
MAQSSSKLPVVVLVVVVLGCAAFGVYKFGPWFKPAATPDDNIEIGAKVAALAAIDKAITSAAAVERVKPARFLDPAKPIVKELAKLVEGDSIRELAFTPDSKFLVSADYGDMHLRVWDWRERKVVSKQKHAHRLTGLALAPDGRGAWTGDAYQNLYFWSISDKGELGKAELVGEKLGGTLQVAISPNGRMVATSSYEQIVSVWDTQTRKQLAQGKGEAQMRLCAFSTDSARLVVGSTTNFFVEYDLAAGKARKVPMLGVRPDADHVAAVFSPDGKHFSTGHTQPYVTVWDAGPMNYRHFLECSMSGICAVAYSPDSKWLAFAQGNGDILLWDPNVKDNPPGCVAMLRGHEKFIKALAFSPDGKVLASGDEGGRIVLWAKAD